MQKKLKFKMFTFMLLIILGLTFQPAISTYAACPDDIFSWWKLDESTPVPPAVGTYADSFDGNTGTGNANPTAAAGQVGGAQQFDGATTGIDVLPNSSFSWYQNQSFSIEFWIKRDGGIAAGDPTEVAIGRDDGVPGNSLQWFVGIEGDANNTIIFSLGDNNGGDITFSGATVVTDNTFHHVVAVRDGANDQNLLYVDGALDVPAVPGAGIYDSGFDSTTAELNIGYLDLAPFFRLNGFLDEIALYNRALTAGEILQHFNDGRNGQDYCLGVEPFVPFPDDIFSWWKLDESTPVPPAVGTYADSFDGNTGTGNANPTAAAGQVGGAQQFDGATTGIDVLPNSSFSWYQNQSFSIEFWIKRDGGIAAGDPTEVAIGRDDGVPGNSLQWFVGIEGDANNTIIFSLGDNNGGDITFSGATVVTDNTFHHVVAVRDGANDQNLLYVDGALDVPAVPGAGIYDSGFDSTTAELNIGYLDLAPFFRLNGFLDEIALYNRALTAGEILQHFNDGRNGKGIETSRPAPTADAVANPTNPKETTSVTLDGSGSTPGYAGAPIATYLWEQISGTPVNNFAGTSTDTATFDAPDFVAAGQPLIFRLTVTASDGQSDIIDTINVTVVDRVPPVANAVANPPNVTEGDTVTLDGTGSSDADGTIATYQWVETTTTGVALSDATAPSPTFTAPPVTGAAVTLTFELTVTDDDGLSDTDSVSVTINDNPIAPTADAGPDQTVTEGAAVTLDGTGSSAAAGRTIATYQWVETSTSGVTLSGAATDTATFTAPPVTGAAVILTFQLTVTDDVGETSSATTSVTVNDRARGGGGGGGGGCFINSMF